MENKDRIRYFEKRISRIDSERNHLALRELQTLDTIRRISSLNAPIRSVLDLGCGDKFLEQPFRQRSINYTGLDVKDCNFDTEDFPYPDNTFDLIISLAVIEHLANPIKALAECRRVLSHGGILYVTTPNWKMDHLNFYNDYTHISPFTPTSLTSAFQDVGFTRVSTYPGLRCKPDWFYKGKLRFLKAYYLLPFRGSARFAPGFLKGHARSIICIGQKP